MAKWPHRQLNSLDTHIAAWRQQYDANLLLSTDSARLENQELLQALALAKQAKARVRPASASSSSSSSTLFCFSPPRPAARSRARQQPSHDGADVSASEEPPCGAALRFRLCRRPPPAGRIARRRADVADDVG